MSGRSARSIRNFSLELWQDLVLLDVRKSTFQHLTVNWNLNVLEMTLKTLHIVQGLSRTPLLFIPRYLINIFFKNILQKNKNPENRKSEIQKPRFTNRSPVDRGRSRTWGGRVPRHFSSAPASLGHGLAPPPPGHGNAE